TKPAKRPELEAVSTSNGSADPPPDVTWTWTLWVEPESVSRSLSARRTRAKVGPQPYVSRSIVRRARRHGVSAVTRILSRYQPGAVRGVPLSRMTRKRRRRDLPRKELRSKRDSTHVPLRSMNAGVAAPDRSIRTSPG